jgi:hypothetical protein
MENTAPSWEIFEIDIDIDEAIMIQLVFIEQ